MKHGYLSTTLYCRGRPCLRPLLYQRYVLCSLGPFDEKLGALPLWFSDVSCHKKEEKKKNPHLLYVHLG